MAKPNYIMKFNESVRLLNGLKMITREYPIEFHFYDDYLIVFRPDNIWDSIKEERRREIYTVKYTDIHKCLIKAMQKRLFIYGDMNVVWYKIDEYGRMQPDPVHNHFEQGMRINIMSASVDEMLAREIEKHSPIKVEIENE